MSTLPASTLYIDGALRPAAANRTYDVIGPWTGEVVSKAPDASPQDVSQAIAAARRAFDQTDWSTSHGRRYELVCELRDLLVANRERLVAIVRHEAGSAMGAVFGPQVDGALTGLCDLLQLFEKIVWQEERGRHITQRGTTDRWVVHEAIGVVGAITPWNVPFYINFAKVASALLAGCTVVLKPAPNTPSSGTIMGELAAQAGFPAGVFNVVTSGDPVMAGEMLVDDPRVDLISFTGSTAVGKRIMERGAATLKRVFLELGGKSANIILDDAPDFALQIARSIVCFHAGQGCGIPTRLLVSRKRYAEAVAILEKAYAGYSTQWGDFNAPTCIMGPVISRRQQQRVMGYIESGKAQGARLLAGGRIRTDKGGGFFIEPTCFVDVTNDMKIAREEIFGPVLSVIAYEDDEDAIRIANDSDYGLIGNVVSGNPERALKVARRVRAGAVSINGGASVTGDLPFGGYKHSGIGREWGIEGIYEYMETKAIGVAVA
ncbi:MAG TPA: aldehyde dehydrogenase family protein [Steroidobacteraceae bacterium]|nr:aldehyde dehydrogenase family protein [Steroidobacteraceae bacterium]